MSQPSVSVVIPTRDQGWMLREALESIFAQGVDAEVIIVQMGDCESAGSIPETNRPEVTILKGPVSGRPAECLNLAMDHVRGRWFLPWDVDDMLFPGSLARLVELAACRDLGVLGGDAVNVGENVRFRDLDPAKGPKCVRVRGTRGSDFANPFVPYPLLGRAIFRSEIARRVRCDEQLRYGMDTLFSIDAISLSSKSATAGIPFRAYRIHEGQMSNQAVREAVAHHDERVALVLKRHPELERYRRGWRASRIMAHAIQSAQDSHRARVGLDALGIALLVPGSLVRRHWWGMVRHGFIPKKKK